MHNEIEEVLISEEEIQNKCAEIGRQLTAEYEGKFPLVIGVLKGATLFMSDIARNIETHVELDFVGVSCYGSGMRSTGAVTIINDLTGRVEGTGLLSVEDIIGRGCRLSYLVDLFKYRTGNCVGIGGLLDKPT